MNEDFNMQGASIDTRPEEAKLKDINQVELVVSVAPVIWKEKKDKDWRKFPEQNQKSSGSCVAQTVKKLALINLWLKEKTFEIFSATSIYTYRSNKPSGGMIGVEAFDIWKNKGIALESMVPSEQMSDGAMDDVVMSDHDKEVAKSFAVANHVGLSSMDFEGVASTIQATGKGVMVWFYFDSKNNYKEWAQKFPQVYAPINLYASTTARHSVAAVDFGLINGKKYIKIEDSALFGGIGERWISEEYFTARNWFSRYPMNFRYQDSSVPTPPAPTPEPTPAPIAKPKYTFTKTLDFIPLTNAGTISDLAKNVAQEVDVKKLQDILRYEGLFPMNVKSTGYYGATTAKAVYNWQVKHAVAPLSELDSIVPKGGRVGNKTIISLNKIYG